MSDRPDRVFTRNSAFLNVGNKRYVYRRDRNVDASDLDESDEIFPGENPVHAVQEPNAVIEGAGAQEPQNVGMNEGMYHKKKVKI